MAPPTPPAAVVFDNDGLILDSEEVWTRGEEVLYRRRGMEFTLDHKQELVGQNAAAAGLILERRLGEPGRAMEIIAELDIIVMEELAKGVEPMPGAVEVLEAVGSLGLPRGLVSNSPRAFIELALDTTGLQRHFDVTLSAHEVAEPKPAPDPYIEACAQLGVEPARGDRAGGLADGRRRRPRRGHDRDRDPLGPRRHARRGSPRRARPARPAGRGAARDR